MVLADREQIHRASNTCNDSTKSLQLIIDNIHMYLVLIHKTNKTVVSWKQHKQIKMYTLVFDASKLHVVSENSLNFEPKTTSCFEEHLN